MQPLKKIDFGIKLIFRLLISGLRPFIGPMGVCPFTIGCTEYALLQLSTLPIHKALFHILHRLLLCNPISGLFRRLYHP